jgi:hypothetical protein
VDDRQQRQSGLLMTTDACLPSAALGEAPLGARVLIHYDLPAKKEAYMRRMAACLAAAPVMGMTAGRATVGTSTISQPGLSSGSGTNGGAHVGGVWGEAILRLGSTTIIQCPVFILPICLELSILCLMKNGIYQGKYCLVHCFTIGLIYS